MIIFVFCVKAWQGIRVPGAFSAACSLHWKRGTSASASIDGHIPIEDHESLLEPRISTAQREGLNDPGVRSGSEADIQRRPPDVRFIHDCGRHGGHLGLTRVTASPSSAEVTGAATLNRGSSMPVHLCAPP